MKIKGKGINRAVINRIAGDLGLRFDNYRQEGNYHLGVLRVAGSRMGTCGAKTRGPDPVNVCTRRVHRDGAHIERDAAGKIVARWTMGDFVHPAYKYRKRGFCAMSRGSEAFGGNGAVCFHGHKRFMLAIFAIDPDAKIRTKLAAYLGLASFKAQFDRVGDSNAGSRMNPIAYRDMCGCDESDEREVEFGALLPPKVPGEKATLVNVRHIRQGDLLKCPFAIFLPSHYREDGTCKCNDPMHRAMMIKEWGYTTESFKKAGINIPPEEQ